MRPLMRSTATVVVALALLLAACSETDDGLETSPAQEPADETAAAIAADDETAGPAEPESVDPDDFCQAADAFITDDSVSAIESFSAEFFADVDSRLAALIEAAPEDGVRADLEALRVAFADSGQIFAEFDYDVTDPRLGPALERVDDETLLSATANIQAYLAESCEIGPGPVVPEQVADIMTAFSIEQELAECINAELGDVANIDSEELTPELLTTEVCGTTLLALLSGGGS